MSDKINDGTHPDVELDVKVEAKTLFYGDKHCVAVNLVDGEPDGFLYVAEYDQNGNPGRVVQPNGAVKVWSSEDFPRAEKVAITLVDHLDALSVPVISDETGANAAIVKSITPVKS